MRPQAGGDQQFQGLARERLQAELFDELEPGQVVVEALGGHPVKPAQSGLEATVQGVDVLDVADLCLLCPAAGRHRAPAKRFAPPTHTCRARPGAWRRALVVMVVTENIIDIFT
jgi:hypothetical protein